MTRDECEHGSLRRSCEICHLIAERDDLKADLADVSTGWEDAVALNHALDIRLKKAERVVEASRAIRAKYPDGKLLWFHEFSEFEQALAEYDRAREEGEA